MSTSEPQRSSGVTEVDGVGLAWTRHGPRGTGAPVVLAHGLTDAAACWGRFARLLAVHHDVVAYDARGHGASDRATDYSVEAHTHDLVGLVRALRLEAPVVIGHSMGGVHAVLVADELDVSGLVLEDPAWTVVPADGSKDVEASRLRTAGDAELPDAERQAVGRARHPSWNDDDLLTWAAAQTRVDPDVVDWFHSWRVTNRWRKHVEGLTCPGLLVIGAPSAVTPAAAAEARGLWPALRVVQVSGAGHDVRRDRFEAFWAEVAAFLDAPIGTSTSRRPEPQPPDGRPPPPVAGAG